MPFNNFSTYIECLESIRFSFFLLVAMESRKHRLLRGSFSPRVMLLMCLRPILSFSLRWYWGFHTKSKRLLTPIPESHLLSLITRGSTSSQRWVKALSSVPGQEWAHLLAPSWLVFFLVLDVAVREPCTGLGRGPAPLQCAVQWDCKTCIQPSAVVSVYVCQAFLTSGGGTQV